MNIKIIFALALIGIVLAGCTQTQTQNQNNPQGGTQTGTQNQPATGNVTISITETGYEPQQVTIKKGSTVTWTNNSGTDNWPASAMHPDHTVYPGSGIEKCGTSEQPNIFDACKGLKNGESFSFTFNEVGEWGYHNHLNARQFGKIIVTE